jgi:hypothetical protein
LIFDKPLSWPAFAQTVAALTALRGPDLLRVKGLVAIEECRGPVVVHFVQHVAHPPVELEDWPDGDRGSRLVFVTRGLPRATVVRLFTDVAAIAVFSWDIEPPAHQPAKESSKSPTAKYASASSQVFKSVSAKRSRRINASATQTVNETLSILARGCIGYGQ